MEEKLIGHFGVDAGLVMICDPCYIYSQTGEMNYNEFPKTWNEFLNKFLYKNGEHLDYSQMNFKSGHSGLGVISSTGYGDGVYPVYATIDNGVIVELRIVFDEPYEQYEEDEFDNGEENG